MALTTGAGYKHDLGEVIMYVVHVVFRIVPERLEDFLVAVKENAATSLAGDYGCRQFDVSLAADGSNDVLLYEQYDTAECFATHLTQAHYDAFSALTQPWTREKIVTFFNRVS